MTYAFVDITSAGQVGAGVSYTQTLARTYAAHDRAIVWVRWITSVGDTLAVTDDGGNTYTLVGTRLVDGTGTSSSFEVWECLDTAAGSVTITATWAGGAGPNPPVGYPAVACLRYTGLDPAVAGVVARQSQASPGTGTNAVTSTTLTPGSQPGALIGISYDDDGGAITAGSGTSRGTIATMDALFGTNSRIQDQRLTSTSAVESTFTASGGSDHLITFGYFAPEPGGGPTINTQPVSATVYQGQTANFTIAATTSGGTLHYQWKDDGSNVGTDSNSYTTAATVLSDSGSLITCVVTDDNGNTTSQAAILTVIPTATIAWISA